jgi:hypothetical protein
MLTILGCELKVAEIAASAKPDPVVKFLVAAGR